MIEITEKEYEEYQALLKVWKHLNAERTGAYFICGSSTDKDDQGLPEMLMVCPSHGLDYSVMYKRVEK